MKKRKPHRGRGGNPAKRAPVAKAPAGRREPPMRAPMVHAARRAGGHLGRILDLPRAVAIAAPREDRQALALLFAPFLIIAASLALEQAFSAAQRHSPVMVMAPTVAPRPAVPRVAPPPALAARPDAAMPQQPGASDAGALRSAPPAATLPAERTTVAIRRAPPPLADAPRIAVAPLPAPAPERAIPPAAVAPIAPTVTPLPASARPDIAVPLAAPMPLPQLALLDLARPAPAVAPPPPTVDTAARPPHAARPVEVCEAPSGLFGGAPASSRPAPQDARQFGLALAAAARAQIDDLTVYNARYQRIAYPMGDVPKLYGVCTDVIVRAYRTLGIDLQELIVTTKSGRGDPHIDHRRVEVLRRFLGKHGETLAISDLPEDYRPGDIVTYHRPQNRSSTSHIAIVTDVLAPSGRYMIAHNRGWGTQLEDALFVDRITGHYRFRGLGLRSETASAESAGQDSTAKPAAGGRAGARRVAESRGTQRR